MTNKKKKELLRAQLLCALILGGNAMLGGAVADADAVDYTSGDYNNDITDTNIAVAGGRTVNINGNLTLITHPTKVYALVVCYGSNGEGPGVLKINMNKNKTVQIQGMVKSESELYVNFSNSDSYLSGSNAGGHLSFSNGANWYVPDNQKMNNITANGGNIDFWHNTPTTPRTTPRAPKYDPAGAAAGGRSCTLSDVGSSLNGANLIISSDIQNNKADHVTLSNVSGSNTYTIKVAYDPAKDIGDGTYTATTAPVVLTTSNSGNTVMAGTYTATRIEAAGLTTVNVNLTPILSTVGSETKLTGLIVGNIPEGDGPAAVMAKESATVQRSALGAWRAENNDLQRRLGDLRWDEGSAGAWARAYGGESEIKDTTSSDVSYHGLQIGYDRARNLGDGRLFTGIALSNMKGSASGSAGSSDLESNLFGVYGSYVGKRGHFIDAIVKYGRLSNNASNTYGGVNYTGDYAANGLNMSLEYGYRKELHDGFYLEPQAELNYGHIDGSSYTMQAGGTSGAVVNNNSTDSLIGRIGINAGRSTKDGNVYLKLSGLHEFNGDTGMTATYSGTTVSSSSSGSDTWLEYGVGFDRRIASNQNLYGEISRSAFADKVSDKWKANLGWRISF